MDFCWVYDKWGEQIGTLYFWTDFAHSDDVLQSIDAVTIITPTIMLQCGRRLQKYDRILWRDDFGDWHENMVSQPTTTHDDTGILYTIYCEDARASLSLEWINERDSYDQSNITAIDRCLENTGWKRGPCDDMGKKDIKFYHESPAAGLADILETWGGEMVSLYTVGPKGVTSRSISHKDKRGADNGLMFTYGHDMSGLKREDGLEDVFTLLHCFGKGEETFDDAGGHLGYGRRVTFAGINNGKDYICDDSLIDKHGILGGNGQKKHAEGVAIFEDIDDPRELLEKGKEKFDEVSKPRVAYTATVGFLSDIGYDWHNARGGDVAHIRDEELDERFSARVLKIIRHYPRTMLTELEVSNATRTITEVISQTVDTVGDLSDRSDYWDQAASAGDKWIDHMIDNLNGQFNAGGSYHYTSTDIGDIWCSVPLATDANGKVLPKPSRTPAAAIQICSAGLRIAANTLADGSFNWRTFGTGEGFTADVINAGTIRGGSNEWDLETGTLEFKQGVIKSSDGKNAWDLSKGTFVTDSMTANNLQANGTFVCGTQQNGMRLTSDGKLAGYRNNAQVGYINYMGTIQDELGRARNGLLISGGTIGFDVDEIYVRVGSTNYRMTSGTAQYVVLRNVMLNGDGSLSLVTGNIMVGFHHGLCSYFDVW